MKLELEFASPKSSASHQFPGSNNSTDMSEMLKLGVKYAKEGNRDAARQLLSRVTDAEPDNETAWLWLASISEYPEELLVFLQNVLKSNPNHERAIEWQKATKSHLAKTFVERGINASQENQKDFANQCFMQALMHDNQNEMAWLWLASNADSPEEKISHLQKVLSINSDNETALASLKSLKHEMSQSLLKKANFAAISGERQQARQLLDEAMQNAPELEEAWILKAYLADDSHEKIACYEKILDLNPENEAAQAGLASLKAMIERNVAQKSNAETLQEVLRANSSDFSELEKSSASFSDGQESAAGQISENPDLVYDEFADAQSPEEEEDSSQNFSSQPQAAAGTFAAEPFESPTDELDASFAEEAKSLGNFSDAPAETRRPDFEAFSEQDEVLSDEDQIFNDFPTLESLAEELNMMESASGSETLPETDSEEILNFEEPDEEDGETQFSAQTKPGAEDYSQPAATATAANPHSYETTLLEENYLTKVAGDSGYSEPNREAFSGNTALEENFNEPEVLLVDDESEGENAATGAAEGEEDSIHKTPVQGEPFTCPFCYVMNPPQAVVCSSCQMMLSLSDLEMLLAHTGVHPEVLEMAIEDLEAEHAGRGLNETELTNLGIAHLNAKNLRKGLSCLQEVAQMNPNDIVLAAKINFLAIRLSEIEAHDSKLEGTVAKNLTVMVIDDSPTVRKLISGKLEKCGHTVVCAADGAEAMSKIREVVPDLILLDIMMPQMDGYQVCKLIRSNEPTKDVPVIMISGKDGFFDKVRGRMAGTTGYITKPFGPETLMKTIETYVV